MFELSKIRTVIPADLASLKTILDETELFPSEMLEEMLHPFFNDPNNNEHWKAYEHDGQAIAFLYCEQERMTESTWNVLAIAVLPRFQNKGIGALLMSNIEHILIDNQQTTLIVEASGLPEFEGTRHFYERIGYNKEAIIRDFYAIGDDKVVFWKSLN